MMARPLFRVRSIKDLKDMLAQSTQLFGDKTAFSLKGNDDKYYDITYNEFKNDIDALGTAMLSLGLKDCFIAVLGENRYEWCTTYLAVVNGTGTIVPLDKELPEAEIKNLLSRSKASAIIFSGKYEKEMKMTSAVNSSVKYFINMDLEEDDEQGFLSYRKLLEKGRALIQKGDHSFIDAAVNPDIMNILLFTSGTTDLAKGVMLSHKNICSDILSVCSVLYVDNTDSVLSILPVHHTYECTCGFLLMLYNGCKISFNEGLKHIAKNLKETSPSVLMLVPLILEAMYKKIWDQAGKKKGGKKKLKAAMFISDLLLKIGIDIRRKLFKQIHEIVGGRIRLIISGAAAIDPQVLKGFRSFGITVLQGYGLTECSPIATVNHMKSFRNKSIGLALPGVEVRINKPSEDGIGELAIKGDNVMLGYFENPAATEKVLKDGWLLTGDLGKLDKHHFFYITGRQKNVIVTKNGKNIYPEEVEAYLNKSPFIQESLVWGKVDEASEETFVYAQIVPAIDAIKEELEVKALTAEDIFKLIDAEVKIINKSMPLYKRIRRFTVREEEFAKTTTKKIKRYAENVN